MKIQEQTNIFKSESFIRKQQKEYAAMELTDYEDHGIKIIAIKGRLSADNCESFRSRFLEFFKSYHSFVFDLSEMDGLDSTGLGTLVFCYKSCAEAGGMVKLASLTDRVRMIFEITKAYRIFDIYDEVDEAIETITETGKN